MQQTIKDLKNDVFGKDIYLIGGGTSFVPSDYVDILPPSQIICLNDALKDFKECLAVMWMDGSWHGNNLGLIREKRHKYAISVNQNVQYLSSDGRLYMSIKNASCGQCDYTVKREKYNVCGNNIGACAIDLLDQLGARTIYLLGFDCREENGKSHYHNRYTRTVSQNIYNKNFIPCFDRLSKHIKTSKVMNLSKNTRIDCFTKISPDSILDLKSKSGDPKTPDDINT